MTDAERARRIYARYCNEAKARSKPFTTWEKLPEHKRESLIHAAGRLRAEYAAAGNPPSFGISDVRFRE